MKALFGIIVIGIIGIIGWNQYPIMKSNYISNYDFNSSNTYKHLDNILQKWCDENYFVKPKLYMRFNPTNEGFYGDNQITLLVKPDTYFSDSDFLEVALAHEFGHHYSYIKVQEDLDPQTEEAFADIVALKLIGIDKMRKVLFEEGKDSSQRLVPNQQRIDFLEKINLKTINL